MKALLFDIDGVLIRQAKWFSMTLSDQKYRRPHAVLNEFHEGPLNRECDQGLKDPLVEIVPFLERMHWDLATEEYFTMKYEHESQSIDFDLLSKIHNLRDQGTWVFVASNQDHHRKAFLKRRMNLDAIFHESFFSCDFGYAKPDQEYWDCVMARVAHHSSEIGRQDLLFLDDSMENIDSARTFGMNAAHIRTRNDILSALESGP